MKWISALEQKPSSGQIIVAIMNGRQECQGDPVESVEIVMLREYTTNPSQWRTMDCTQRYYFPPNEDENYYQIIQYWIPWQEFPFPELLILDKQ